MRRLVLPSLMTLPLALLHAPVAAQITLAAAEQPPFANVEEDDDEMEAGEPDDIVVIAARLRGQVDVPQAPIAVFDEADLEAYGAASITDLIEALGPQVGSGRGRGGGMPVILLNGRRISSFREMRHIPPEAIRRMEIVPEEVALRFGYKPDQRVMNFILKEQFSGRSASAEYNAPTRGGFAETEFEASLLTINKDDRFNLHVEAKDGTMLTEAERNVIQQPGTLPTVPGDPDPARYRSLVSDSRDLELTGSWSRGLASGASISANGSIERSDSRSLSGLNVVELAAPDGSTAIRTLGDPLTRISRTIKASGGAAFDKPVGGWQLSATVDGSIGKTRNRIDRRADTRSLVDAAAAGTLPIDGPLPDVAGPGTDTATTRNTGLNSLITFAGSPFLLPAGEAMATINAGYAYTGIRSSDTRALTGDVSLKRHNFNAGVNLSVPITSRRDEVLGAVGDISLNFSAGINELSDFGTLTDWSAGLNWSPTEKLNLQASYIVNEEAPSLGDLGNPLVQTFNVPVYDFVRGETSLVTIIGGGNPDLVSEKQRDLKLSANWELPFLQRSNLVVEYFHNRSNDVTSAFPVLTPEIEAAFQGRVVRDPSGQLITLDRRPVTFDEIESDRLRYGFNISGTIGKAKAGEGGSGGVGGASRGAMRGGGRGRMGGGGNGQGRWNLSLFHTIRFSETVRISPSGPVLDLLDGDALTGGGVARNSFQFEGGAFHRGFGLRLNGRWTEATTLKGSGLPGSSTLRFGSLFNLDARIFVNFDQQKSVVEAVPFLKGSRLSFNVDNVFDNRQKVTDENGMVPLSYQPDYMDPRGRFFGIDFRKSF